MSFDRAAALFSATALSWFFATSALAAQEATLSARAEPVGPASGTQPNYRLLERQTAVFGGFSFAAMGLLWEMPASASQWYDKPELSASGLYHRWHENVSKGPIWDGDIRIFNSYGHIHTGAANTVMCLDAGLSVPQCMVYAHLISAYWEYGPEALVEIPSWQDLLMTGLVGSRVGVHFAAWKRTILANDGELLGSRALGAVAVVVLDPFGSLTRNLLEAFGAETSISLHDPFDPSLSRLSGRKSSDWALGLDLGVRF